MPFCASVDSSLLVTDPPPPVPLFAETRFTRDRYSALVTEAPPPANPLTVLDKALWALAKLERTALVEVTSAESVDTRLPTLVICAETALPFWKAALKVLEMAFRTLWSPFTLVVAEAGEDQV